LAICPAEELPITGAVGTGGPGGVGWGFELFFEQLVIDNITTIISEQSLMEIFIVINIVAR